ncbi:hypothetical protein SEA_LAZERLEMON_76 [Streptomyces phage LazerLemon]|nr:hypothetical protein SEA_LAZERLEMON_76 [Streptomyces phage LazerLemon]
MTKWCRNPECGEEFSPDEYEGDYCSWECMDRVTELEDQES